VAAAAEETSARIYDQGYTPWRGTLASPRSRFLCIARNELRLAWKEKWFKRLAVVALLPLPFFAVFGLFAALVPGGAGAGAIWGSFWNLQLFFVMLMVYFVGRRGVGADLRAGALAIYFSRPVGFRQYLAGKWLSIAVAVAGVTLLPGLLLALVGYVASPAITTLDFLRLAGGVVLLSALLALTAGSVMLAVSALTRRPGAAGILWVVLFYISSAFASGLTRATGAEGLASLSFVTANTNLATAIFEARAELGPALVLVAGQLGWAALGCAVVLLRLRRFVRA